jgi:heat shock transcription factor, other eukaryote
MRRIPFSFLCLLLTITIRLVNDPETDEYVRWNDAGTSFVIPNSQLMAENVLPRSYKTINFASFVRQLNSNVSPKLRA